MVGYKTFDDTVHGTLEGLAKVCQTCGAVVVNSRLHDEWHEQFTDLVVKAVDEARRRQRL